MGLAKKFPGSEVHVGGCGIDLTTNLPDEIEHLMPYYDLYPDCNFSLGYTSRGCPRNCEFCIVPQKEGKVRPVADIYEFWDHRHGHIVLMDNNLLALPDHFKKIVSQIKENNLSVDFNQALDIRLLTEENAKLLRSIRVKPSLRFSWDNIEDEDEVVEGVRILKSAGINRSQFFVLSGFNSTFEDDLYRLNKLRVWKQIPYLMRFETVYNKYPYILLAMWANQPHIFYKMTFEEFVSHRNYVIWGKKFTCTQCGYEWNSDLADPKRCPKCDSKNWRRKIRPPAVYLRDNKYYYATWVQDGKTRNFYLGNSKNMTLVEARKKALEMKTA
jgi:ssDNA-binding Zn-finger/Zn-ribbon topoisomerase 1